MQPQSGIARPLDFSYQTNRIIVLLALTALLVSAAASALAGTGIVETLIRGPGAALAVFLTWALCREIDPDHDLSALLAAAMTTGALLILSIPDIPTLLWALLVIRVVNRTTGRAATTIDLIFVLLLTLWPLSRGFLPAGPIAATAFFLDGRSKDPARHRLPFAVVALLATAVALLATPVHLGAPTPAAGIGIAAATVLFIPAIAASKTVHSREDSGDRPLDPGRLMTGQALALATALSAVTTDPAALAPLWAAILAAGLWHAALAVQGR
ncbi:MAG: hypothetical protein PHP59_06105 [Methanofollis sp.]|uniref:hypothetical protein n=1 Tax=Methanofollis sp. TaxID=2052835 RepID=UPI002626C697|nr:hypothetical protein [Methanofollis sp.]MDD4254935.1 hypothetical protein [Methanofollis sp.]